MHSVFDSPSGFRVFSNRHVAGRALGDECRRLYLRNPIVLALPRGGVPVGYQVAHLLGAPLDVLIVRKIGAPGLPEVAIGAVGTDGVTVRDEQSMRAIGVGPEYFEDAARRARLEVGRGEQLFREGRPALDLRGRAAILVDDGLATGATMLAAVDVARRLGAAEVIVAVPVGTREARDRVARRADRIVCLAAPEPFVAVGYWYEDFTQTSDAEVRRLLRLSRLEQEPHLHPAA